MVDRETIKTRIFTQSLGTILTSPTAVLMLRTLEISFIHLGVLKTKGTSKTMLVMVKQDSTPNLGMLVPWGRLSPYSRKSWKDKRNLLGISTLRLIEFMRTSMGSLMP